jgi:hypothetical protein
MDWEQVTVYGWHVDHTRREQYPVDRPEKVRKAMLYHVELMYPTSP